MTKQDIDNRVDQIEGLSEKIEFVKEWIFDIDMIDHWSQDEYEISRLLHNKLDELQGNN